MRYRVWTVKQKPEQGKIFEASSGFEARQIAAQAWGLTVTDLLVRLERCAPERPAPDLDKPYNQDPNLIHAPRGEHRHIAEDIASAIAFEMRDSAFQEGLKTANEVETQKLCPGCYTLILMHTLLAMVQRNGDDMEERCAYLAREFGRLAQEAHNGRPLLIEIEGD